MRAAAHIGGWLATVARGVVISAVAFVCVIAYTAGSIRRLAIRDRAARIAHRRRQRGLLLRWCFTQLGATFIKIGQVASSRPDVICPEVIAELRTLQDRVPPFAWPHVRAIVERELSTTIGAHFRSFDVEPVAAGSIAQVHHAELITGEEVAVKVLRPGVRARIRRDSRLLLWLAHIAHAISPRARSGDVIGHTRSLIAGIIAQTDLQIEARNYDQFREAFAGSRDVLFPRVLHEHSTHDLLVMEFIHGVTLDRIPDEQIPRVTHALRDAFLAMCFEHGIVHADLHPGNLLVQRDGTVVLLDLGLVKYLTDAVVEQVADFARCMVLGDAHDLVHHLRTHHHCPPGIDWTEVEQDAQRFVGYLRQHSIAELEVAAVVGRLFELARKHRIRPVSELSLVLLAMVTIEGIAKRLDPKANIMTEVAGYLAPRIAGGRRLARGTHRWEDGAQLRAVNAVP